ncbi:kinase/pyrophosphorylase [Olsenella urininfantis]|uniref:kinase/pyrophosphorylase n=1 Tax=Olsenella urininfantis TaxID=1871033 RepID=UPI0009847C8E|nr:kinase/pyrophosphorylase [Olsenella urininfantis]
MDASEQVINQVVKQEGREERSSVPIVVHVLSDATGNTAVRLAEAAAAQFRWGRVGISQLSNVENAGQVRRYLDRYVPKGEETIVYHTILNQQLRTSVRQEAEEHGIASVDLLGPAMEILERLLGEEPLNVPGLEVNHRGRAIRKLDARML